MTDKTKISEQQERVAAVKQAEQRRELGMARSEAAESRWCDRAIEAMRSYLEDNETFFCDDFWASGLIEFPSQGKALGPVIVRAKRAGWMRITDRSRPSTRSNNARKPVWQSLIWKARNVVE